MGKTKLTAHKEASAETSSDERLAHAKSRQIDPHKKFTNGHKFFLAHESKGYVELLHTEARTVQNYYAQKDLMRLPRNPLNGDPTPRNLDGEPVLNPNIHGTKVGGLPLFPERTDVLPFEQTAKYQTFVKNSPVGKIGVDDTKYNCLGNTTGINISGQPEDLAYLAKTTMEKKSSKAAAQREIAENIRREKAKRQQQILARELLNMKLDIAKKEKDMDNLASTFQL